METSVHPGFPLPEAHQCPFGPAALSFRRALPVQKVRCPSGIDAWLVTRAAEIRELLGDAERFSNRPAPNTHLLTHIVPDSPAADGDFTRMDGEAHQRFRRLFGPELMSRANLTRYEPVIQRIVDNRIDSLAALDTPANLHEHFAQPVVAAVLAELFGIPPHHSEIIERTTSRALDTRATPEQTLEEQLPLIELMYGLVTERRRSPGDDLLSKMLIRADGCDDPISDLELMAMAIILLVAGGDSTVSAFLSAIQALWDNPAQLAALRDAPTAIPLATEELIRYAAISLGGLRMATRRTELGDRTIESGDLIAAFLPAATWDPAHFPDPEHLDITRSGSGHLAFGYGAHLCPGRGLARMEIRIMLETILRRIPTLRPAGSPDERRYRTHNVVLGPAVLPAAWDFVAPA
ncbi:cytochrome P450 [Nocardia flavorosea]|uniref:Cytochrome P450 n=1 Tax=Nocardia flavorosea TaxID=53429 RepID=A0A846YE50_9NOCA|nr:cytochrome P450 [Nocardia flavorosea]NKY57147.1 cytochrome P450 [Nocardia flavorosea]